MGGRKIIMKKSTLITVINSFATMASAMVTDMIETIEEKSARNELKNEWFARFKSLPSAYRVRSFSSETEEVESEIDSAVIIKKKGCNKHYVATISYDREGNKIYQLRSIFTTSIKKVPANDVEIIYKASVENCWLKWFELERENLG